MSTETILSAMPSLSASDLARAGSYVRDGRISLEARGSGTPSQGVA